MDLSQYGFRPDYDRNNRIVKQEYINFEGVEYFVSTVDLGLDHNFGEGPPLYFETMIFPKESIGEMFCKRYTTKETALESHERLVQHINEGKFEIVDGYFERK